MGKKSLEEVHSWQILVKQNYETKFNLNGNSILIELVWMCQKWFHNADFNSSKVMNFDEKQV